jgi:hypothetical protein
MSTTSRHRSNYARARARERRFSTLRKLTMPSAAKLRKRAVNKQAHAIARSTVNAKVDPVEIVGRVFTSKEEEELPERMRDGDVLRRARGALTNEASVNRICDLIARGVTETDARRYVDVCATDWGTWRRHNEVDSNQETRNAERS